MSSSDNSSRIFAPALSSEDTLGIEERPKKSLITKKNDTNPSAISVPCSASSATTHMPKRNIPFVGKSHVKGTPKRGRICISLPIQKAHADFESKVMPVTGAAKQIFDDSEESEEEEMPIEARIRMRNKGRDTPTSSGPNSFGKGRYGFIDQRALAVRQTEALAEAVSADNEVS